MDKFIHDGLDISIRNHYCNAYQVKDESSLVIAVFALSFDSLDLNFAPCEYPTPLKKTLRMFRTLYPIHVDDNEIQ